MAGILEKCAGVKSVKIDSMMSIATVSGGPEMKADDLLAALAKSGSYRGAIAK